MQPGLSSREFVLQVQFESCFQVIADNGHVTVCKLQQVPLNFSRLVSLQLTWKQNDMLVWK